MGFTLEQLDEWKADFESMGASSPADKRALVTERKKNRKLAKELLRKERALAETAASSLLDKRLTPTPRHYPHALTEAEKASILAVSNSPEYESLPPTQIVPRLADKGIYIASESSFYRVLKAHDQLHRRGREKQHSAHKKPKALIAETPNQVWSWDITYLPSAIRGQFYRLYLILDVFSRYIVGWEIHPNESANPSRWKGRKTRDWSYQKSVWLNPPKEHASEEENLKQVA